MKADTLRALDAKLGSALCGLLTAHRALFERPGSDGDEGARRGILFVKLVEQGATVLAYEALVRACERWGREHVHFLVFAENRPILDLLDVVPAENVLAVRAGDPATLALDLARALLRLRALRLDAAVDMELFSRGSAILCYLSGARRRVGLHRFHEEAPFRGDLMTHRVPHNPELHQARAYALLVDALDEAGGREPLPKRPAPERARLPRFAATEAERARAQALLDEAAGHAVVRPLVLLNPNAGDLMPLRRWPRDRWVALGRRLLDAHPRATVAITGAPSERADAEALRDAIGSPRALSLAGRTTLRELLALYGLADVLVTNDSGPAHFASLTEVPSVVLFGPGSATQFGPLGGRARLLDAKLACSPCLTAYNHRRSACTDNVCMQAISVEQVAAAVGERLLRSVSTEGRPPASSKVIARAEAVARVEAWRAEGRRVVFTNGCFDLLHAGHAALLERAAGFGDALVVGLNGDGSVARLKGAGRPLVGEGDRSALLAALACVDAVVLFDEDTPLSLIEALRPDVLVKGGDYRREEIVGGALVAGWGGRVEIVPLVPERSTTGLVARIRGR